MDKYLIHNLFEDQAVKTPYAPALKYRGVVTTYLELDRRANQLAWLLRSTGSTRDTKVATNFSSDANQVLSVLAILKSGGVYVPMDPSFSATRIREVLQTTEVSIVLTSTRYLQYTFDVSASSEGVGFIVELTETTPKVWRRTSEHWVVVVQGEFPLTKPTEVVGGDDSNYIFFTSGSTGAGKPVEGRHICLSHFIHWQMGEFKLNSTRHHVSSLVKMTFDGSLRDIFIPLSTGGTLFIPDDEDRSNSVALLDFLCVNNITLIHTVPSIFRMILKELESLSSQQQWRLTSIQYIFLAGEKLYAKDVMRWRALQGNKAQIVNLYGATETTLAKVFYRVEEISTNPSTVIPVGRPIANTQLAIFDNGMPCAIGEPGEVFIKTPFASKGYYRNPDLTRSVFVQNPMTTDSEDVVHRTGDRGRFLPDMSVEIIDRADRQIKVNGVRVDLAEVEMALVGIPQIREVFVRDDKDQDNNTMLICYYTGEKMNTEDLDRALQNILNREIVPSVFVYMDTFPLTTNGKVNGKLLPTPFSFLDVQNSNPPQGDIEQKVANLWKSALRVEKVPRDISFFKIGGTSLLAMHVIGGILREFHVRIIIVDFFENPTIERLARLISSLSTDKHQIIPALAPAASFPLSNAQYRLWLIAQYESSRHIFNMPMNFRFDGPLNIDALTKAWIKLIDRHESLRTIFLKIAGEPRQVIMSADSETFDVKVIDVSQQPDMASAVRSLADEFNHRVFELDRLPLLAMTVLRLGPDQHVCLFNIHHIISDGWSVHVLIDNFFRFYDALATGVKITEEPLRIHYKDFASWQLQLLQSEAAMPMREFWLHQFGEPIKPIVLPYDFARPGVQTFEGDRIFFTFDTKVTAIIRKQLAETDLTLFMYLLSSVNALIYYYSGQKDIVLGTPIAGRDHPDLTGQVGLYVNLLAIRIHLDVNEPVAKLLTSVKETTLKSYQNGAYPFDQLVDTLNIPKDPSRAPLFDIVVQMQDTNVEGRRGDKISGLTLTDLKASFNSSKYDLTFNFFDDEGVISGVLEFNTNLFVAATVQRMAGDFQRVVRELAIDPNRTLVQIKRALRAVEESPVMDQYTEYISGDISSNF